MRATAAFNRLLGFSGTVVEKVVSTATQILVTCGYSPTSCAAHAGAPAGQPMTDPVGRGDTLTWAATAWSCRRRYGGWTAAAAGGSVPSRCLGAARSPAHPRLRRHRSLAGAPDVQIRGRHPAGDHVEHGGRPGPAPGDRAPGPSGSQPPAWPVVSHRSGRDRLPPQVPDHRHRPRHRARGVGPGRPQPDCADRLPGHPRAPLVASGSGRSAWT